MGNLGGVNGSLTFLGPTHTPGKISCVGYIITGWSPFLWFPFLCRREVRMWCDHSDVSRLRGRIYESVHQLDQLGGRLLEGRERLLPNLIP